MIDHYLQSYKFCKYTLHKSIAYFLINKLVWISFNQPIKTSPALGTLTTNSVASVSIFISAIAWWPIITIILLLD